MAKPAKPPKPSLVTVENLPSKYRPTTLEEVVGQPAAVNTINGMFTRGQIPRTILIVGGTGSGKTTLAYLLACKINGVANIKDSPDIYDINVGAEGGVDNMRDLVESAKYHPSRHAFKIFILDEVHRLSGAAASAVLKPTEQPPAHVVWILATNEPQKLLTTLQHRAEVISLQPMLPRDMLPLLWRVARAENVFQPSKEYKAVFSSVAQASGGNPRLALQIFSSIINSHAAKPLDTSDPADIQKALRESLNGLGVGVELVAVKLLIALYQGDADAMAVLQDTQDYPALSQHLLDLNGYVLERISGMSPWPSYSRNVLSRQLTKSKVNPQFEKVLVLHEILNKTRQDIMLSTTSDRHVMLIGIGKATLAMQTKG